MDALTSVHFFIIFASENCIIGIEKLSLQRKQIPNKWNF